MSDDEKKWKGLDDAEIQSQEQKSIDELYDEGYQLYTQCHFKQAAALFSQAASLAKQKGDLSAQCENLYWEGSCYFQLNLVKKALTYFLKADQLNGLDAVTQFYNLHMLCIVALELRLPNAEIKSILNRLSPYKDALQIGGSKSMVLHVEYSFLTICGKYAEALAKAQEAFVSQVNELPMCDDFVYFRDLVTGYYLNGQIADAWTALRRWRKKGSSEFAIEKREQLKTELFLYIAEAKLDDAWDVLQHIKAEERYLGRAGMHVDTLELEVNIGTLTGHLEEAKSALRVIFNNYRNSDGPYGRFLCYKSLARYYFASCHYIPQENHEQMKRHAEFCLAKASQIAEHLDGLIQSDIMTVEIQTIHEIYDDI